MNELKPEDVMRALEICAKPYVQDKFSNCKTCPYWLRDCDKEFIPDVIALIREKDAEINGLVDGWCEDQGRWEKLCDEKDAEIERLTTLAELGKMRANDYRAMRDKAKNARAEAIAEFALRLESCEFYEVADKYGGMQYIDFCAWVDQIAEEMKGATDGKNDL